MTAQALFVVPTKPANINPADTRPADTRPVGITAAARARPIGTAGRRRILHAFLIQTLGYTGDDARGEMENLERSVSDAIVERMDNHLRASSPVTPTSPPAPVRPVRPVGMKLTDATAGGEMAIVRVSDAAPTLLTYLAALGLAAGTRLTVRKRRSNSAVMTIQIRGQAEKIHLGSVASDALWVERTAAA
ncbi:FeoA domain-containing protein [Cryobacterium sp. Sr8]|uniref:metal-dependent transcriptional regulator n=1 Tax=Cryobacterium sp. Sr8 TaxID=1259203 RepID=UPI00141B44D5|nr:FeoA domain-containing protein [Cryobacterium sp. Sr8]